MENIQIGPRRVTEVTPNLSEAQFTQIKSGIDNLITFMRPSGSKGNVDEFGQAAQDLIKQRGVEPKLYWEDVWMKSGCKDVLDYNDSKKGPGAGIKGGPISLETHRSLVQTLEKLVAMGDPARHRTGGFLQTLKSLFRRGKH